MHALTLQVDKVANLRRCQMARNWYQFVRPPDIVVRGLRFYHDSFFLSSFFRHLHLPSELAERNSPKTDHMVGSDCDLKSTLLAGHCSVISNLRLSDVWLHFSVYEMVLA